MATDVSWRNYFALALNSPLNRNHISPENLLKRIQAFESGVMYSCYYELEPRHDYKDYSGLIRPAFGLLHIDLDDDTALEDTRALSSKLTEIGVEHSVFFSGNKGFHVSFKALAAGIDQGPKEEIELKVKTLLKRLKEIYPSVDTGIFNANRKFRCWNSLHEKSGLYKIRLTQEQLNEPLEKIKLHAQKRQTISDSSLQSWSDLVVLHPAAWLQELASLPRDEANQEQAAGSNLTAPQNSPEITQQFRSFTDKLCIQRLASGQVAGAGFNRHDIGLRLIHDLKATGTPLSRAESELRTWAGLVFEGDRDKHDRVSDCVRMLRDAYNGVEYNFGCYDDIKKAYCSAKCSLFDKLDALERAKPLDMTKRQLAAGNRALEAKAPGEAELAEKIRASLGELIQKSGEFFEWTGTHWKRLDNELFLSELHLTARGELGAKATDKAVSSLARHIVKLIRVAPETSHLFSPNPFLFNFKDCTVKVVRQMSDDKTSEVYTLEKHPHNQEDFLSYCQEFNFGNGQGAGNEHLHSDGSFAKYLKHREEDLGQDGVSLLKQMLGACLIPYAPRIFILVGDSNSGKSTLLYLMSRLVGVNNFSSVDPSNADRFAWEPAIGKLLNICTELDHHTPMRENTLKQIRDRVPIVIPRKGIKDIQGCLPPIHAYASNAIPRSLEGNSGALNKRISIIKLSHIESAYSSVIDLGGAIWQGDPRGVIEAAFQGLVSLMQSGFRYLETEQTRESIEQWQLEADPVQQFLKEIETGEFKIKKSLKQPRLIVATQLKSCMALSMYANYEEWRQAAGCKMMSRMKFYKELERISKKSGGKMKCLGDKDIGRIFSWEKLGELDAGCWEVETHGGEEYAEKIGF